MTMPGSTGGGTDDGPPGTGGQTGGGAPQGSGGAVTAPPPADDWADRDEWRALANDLGATPEQVRRALGNARTWEKRAKDNRDGAQRADGLAGQVEALQQQLTDRDTADAARARRVAKTDLRAALVDKGMTREDATDAIEDIDLSRLLDKSGEPDEQAIDAVAGRLAKVAGRLTPDRDQRTGGGDGSRPQTMNDVIRNAARGRRR